MEPLLLELAESSLLNGETNSVKEAFEGPELAVEGHSAVSVEVALLEDL